PTVNSNPHLGQVSSLWRPSSVGAIDPVGMTNASASNVRNRNAKMNAITIDSTVSRVPSFFRSRSDSLCCAFPDFFASAIRLPSLADYACGVSANVSYALEVGYPHDDRSVAEPQGARSARQVD